MFATRKSQGSVNAEANRFLFQLEQEFDLMRLRDRRVVLEQEETRLAEEQASLRSGVRPLISSSIRPSDNRTSGVRTAGWWRAVTKRSAIWWLDIRRYALIYTGYELHRLMHRYAFCRCAICDQLKCHLAHK